MHSGYGLGSLHDWPTCCYWSQAVTRLVGKLVHDSSFILILIELERSAEGNGAVLSMTSAVSACLCAVMGPTSVRRPETMGSWPGRRFSQQDTSSRCVSWSVCDVNHLAFYPEDRAGQTLKDVHAEC